jgi:hypothetical protein
MFSVVKFLKENLVLVVPSIWIDKNKKNCLWPNAQPAQIEKWNKQCKLPEENWTSHPIKVYKTAGKN